MDGQAFRISVGPLLYYWPRRTLVDFYARVADSAAHSVTLGEVVCSRRHEMKPDDWIALARDLAAGGKEVVLATQALIESESELRAMRRWAEQGEFLIEANDAAALHRLAGRPFVIGAHVNVYNGAALAELAALGAVRWVPPVELPVDAVAAANATGHVEHPDGLLLKTQEGEPFLALNGLQTQSAGVQCLLGWRAALLAAGVRRVRLSPTALGFEAAIDAFDRVLNRGADPTEEIDALVAAGIPGAPVDGYARRRAGRTWGHP